MNKRIRELAEQAKFVMNVSNDPNSPPSWWAAGHNDTFEKFAELIVRECVKISEQSQWTEAKGEYYEGFNEAMVYVSNKIKEHFGVDD